MTRRRTAAGLLALTALTGTLVFAGALAANADAGLEFAPSYDGGNFSWSSGGFTFSGTSTTGGTPSVTVWDDSENTLCIAPVVGTAWSCTTTGPLPMGSHTYTATQSIPDLAPAQDVVTFSVFPGAPSYDQSNPYLVPQD